MDAVTAQVCVLRESVDNYDDEVTAFGLGKALDDVHGEITPWLHGIGRDWSLRVGWW